MSQVAQPKSPSCPAFVQPTRPSYLSSGKPYRRTQSETTKLTSHAPTGHVKRSWSIEETTDAFHVLHPTIMDERNEFPFPVMPVKQPKNYTRKPYKQDLRFKVSADPPDDDLSPAWTRQRPNTPISAYSSPRVPKPARRRVPYQAREDSIPKSEPPEFPSDGDTRPSFSTESTLCSPLTPDAIFEDAVTSLKNVLDADDLGLTVSKMRDLQTFADSTPAKRQGRVLVQTEMRQSTHPSINDTTREAWKAMTTEEVHSIRVSRWNAWHLLKEQYRERKASDPSFDESALRRQISEKKSAHEEAYAEYKARVATDRARATISPDLSVVSEYGRGNKKGNALPKAVADQPCSTAPAFKPIQWSRFSDSTASITSSVQPSVLDHGTAQIATVGTAVRVNSLYRRESCDDYLPGTQAPRNSFASVRSDVSSILGEGNSLGDWKSAAAY